ncbi:MAG: glycosyltransferase family 87 protein [Sulfurisoma sp.]|nr:glycosyltransferase family 87 protein [Sulfurisoma sp.]
MNARKPAPRRLPSRVPGGITPPPPAPLTQTTELPRRCHGEAPLRYSAIFIILGTTLNATFNTIMAVAGHKRPYTSFLFTAEDLFADFLKTIDWFGLVATWNDGNEYDNMGLWHLTPPYFLALFISAKVIAAIGFAAAVSVLIQIAWLSTLLWVLNRSQQSAKRPDRVLFLVAVLVSYPVLFTIQRGNLAGVTVACIGVAVYLIELGGSRVLGAMLLAMATGLKFTPALFGLSLLGQRNNWGRYFLAYSCMSVGVVVGAVSLNSWLVDGYNLDRMLAALRYYQEAYILGPAGIAYGSSLLNLFKSPFFAIDLRILVAIHQASMIIFVLWGLLVWWLFRKALINRYDYYGLLAIDFVLLTPAIGDYYLLILFVPFLFLPSRFDRNSSSVVLLFGALLCLIPKHYLFLDGVSMQSIANPLILATSALVFVFHRTALGWPKHAGSDDHTSTPTLKTGHP